MATNIQPIKLKHQLHSQLIKCQLSSQPIECQPQSQPIKHQLHSQPIKCQLSSQPIECQPQSQPIKHQLHSQPIKCQLSSQPIKSQPYSQPNHQKSHQNPPVLQQKQFYSNLKETEEDAITKKANNLHFTGNNPSILSVGQTSNEMVSNQNHFRQDNQSQPGKQILKAFTCEVCGKVLSRRDHLKLHATIHTGIRPYVCDYCGVSFSRNHHLVRHMASHMTEKRYKCDICGKGLSRSDHLKVHRRIHTGERPFKCNICGFAFSRRDRLIKHNQLNNGRRKLSCVPPSFVPAVGGREGGEGTLQRPPEQVDLDRTNKSDFTSHLLGHSGHGTPEDPNFQPSPPTIQNRTLNESDGRDINPLKPSNGETSSEPDPLHISSLTGVQFVCSEDLASKISPFPNLVLANGGEQMPVFPTTIQMTSSPAHLFPTLQIYSNSPQLNLPSTHIYATK